MLQGDPNEGDTCHPHAGYVLAPKQTPKTKRTETNVTVKEPDTVKGLPPGSPKKKRSQAEQTEISTEAAVNEKPDIKEFIEKTLSRLESDLEKLNTIFESPNGKSSIEGRERRMEI